MGLLDSLEERARRLAEDARRLAADSGLKARAAEAAASLGAARDRLVPQPVRERVEALRDAVHDGVDRAAVAVAAKVSELRGVETTPAQVKRVAARLGVALLAAGAASAIADALATDGGSPGAGDEAGGGGQGDVAGAGAQGEGAGAGGQGDGAGSGDVLSDARMGLAKHGHSVNVSTTVVDGDGCVLDHGG